MNGMIPCIKGKVCVCVRVYTCIYLALKISGSMYEKLLRMVICKMRREYAKGEKDLTLYDLIYLGRKIYTLYIGTQVALRISRSIHKKILTTVITE